jgi:hypothetical protein
VFFTGARHLIRAASNGNGHSGVRVDEAGVPLYAPDGALDPTINGPRAAGMVLIHGPIARILTAVALIAIASAVSRTRMLSRWVTVTGYLLAAINLAFLPSLYFGMNPAHFYAANGWGSTARWWDGPAGPAPTVAAGVSRLPTDKPGSPTDWISDRVRTAP